MPRKLEFEDVKEFFKSKGYELLSNEYLSSGSRMTIRDNDGFMYLSSYSALNGGTKPRKYDAQNPYSIQNIKLWLTLNNKSIELISDIYNNKTDKLEWKCLICNDNFFSSWDFIQKHKNKDSFIRHGVYPKLPCFRANERFTLEQVREFVKDLGYELLSSEYKNKDTDLIIKDKEGYIYNPTYGELRQGNNPEKVSKFNPYSIENLRMYLKLNNPKYILVSDEYKDCDSEIILKDNDGYFYNTRWNLLQSGRFPRFVAINNKFSLHNIKLWVKLNNKPFELLSEEYVGTKDYLQWKCLKDNCGEVFESSWGDISQGHGCGYCYGTKACLSNCLATNNPYVASEWHKELNGELTPYDVAKYSGTYAWWKCNKCDHEWRTLISNRTFLNNGCPICALKNKSGEGHHNWKGGITPLHHHLRNKTYYWIKQSEENCNYKCIVTNSESYDVHHLHGFDRILEETINTIGIDIRYNISNYTDEELRLLEETFVDIHNKYPLGVCLRTDIHELFHQEYGYGQNTEEQFEEFIRKYDTVKC